MMFDRLWWAERRDAEALKKLRHKFKPQFDAAQTKGSEEVQADLRDYISAQNYINEAECLRSKLIIRKAHRLGIAIPPNATGYEDNDDWNFNQATGDLTLSAEAALRLTREVRKEEMERLQHQMRWVSQAAIPVIGFIGSLMGLISLIHALRK
jgi:hypothetical protein